MQTAKNKMVLLICLLIFLSVILAYAISGRVTSFYSQTNPFNITWDDDAEDSNVTYYIIVPSGGYVQNMTITIEGLYKNLTAGTNPFGEPIYGYG